MRKYIVMLVLLLAIPAHAGRVVMSYSDSRGGTADNVNTSYPKLLDQARPDFIVCNKYHNGWTSQQGMNNFATDLAACRLLGDVTDVLILFGINDFLYIGGTSEAVAVRNRSIALSAYLEGVNPWILLEPPGPIAWGGYVYMDARKWTRDNVDWLKYYNGLGPYYNLINIRDEFIATPWYSSACSSDSLHPTALACRQIIANKISLQIP